MKRISFATAIKHLKKNLRFLVSTVAALCLIFSPTGISLVLAAVVFAATVAVTAMDAAAPNATLTGKMQIVRILLTVVIMYTGFHSFTATWSSSDRIAKLAGALGMTAPALLRIVGAAVCMIGAYTMYVLAFWIVSWTAMLLKERLPVQDKAAVKANLRRNWFLPISAVTFFFLELRLTVDFFLGLIIVLLCMTVIASQVGDPVRILKGRPWYFILFVVLSGIGICLRGQRYLYTTWGPSSTLKALGDRLPFNIDIAMCISLVSATAAFYFVCVCLTCFWTVLAKTLSISNSESPLPKWAAIIFVGLALVLMIGSSAVFIETDAFYGTDIDADVIYTSDSPMLLENDVYISVTYVENDLRQPLFAVFAAPFMGIPYLIYELDHSVYSVHAIIVNAVQIAMLIFTNYLLTKMLKLSPCKAVCFMMLSCCSYSQLLSVLMMEQYIVAYFWLILCMYLIAEKQQPDRIALWGAGGTLLTGMILLPFMSKESPIRNSKQWLADTVKYGTEFIGLMLLMGRFDVFYSLSAKISALSSFTGKTITFTDRAMQYIAFIRSCMFAPNAGVDTQTFEHISWQLNPVTDVDFAGMFLLFLVIASAVWNRDQKSALLAAGWVGLSLVMLLGLGWGTAENGLILYALYFGWAFLVLLFRLVEKIESTLNVSFVIPVFTLCTVAALLIINIPAIMEMVNFAITYYPL